MTAYKGLRLVVEWDFFVAYEVYIKNEPPRLKGHEDFKDILKG
ncbi:hypothetical protein [Gloeocapsa sp. PCC 7428]|nr:hypothetical protein [Gloeocapsa sp. PCC 7428]